MLNNSTFRISTLSAAIASTLLTGQATAQNGMLEEVIVTATRRAASVQDIPINITALGSDLIARERLSDLSDIARRVPGMVVVDQGPRSGNILTVRGLNVDSLTASENSAGNSGGSNVGIYLGEVPIYIDLKLNDMERIEVLIGPQGTLYGSGTLGGAVRYIPNKPRADETTIQLRGDVYDLEEADDLGYEGGGTINIPIIDDRLAFRASLDYVDDPGFIDYNYLVREAGVSNPQPDFSNAADVNANLYSREDVNTEKTWSARAAVRYTGDMLDATLSYYYQDMEIGGRQINHKDSFNTGKYESAHRFEEPNERKNELIALELVADLGFAELTSATGYSEYNENGNRDQTDFLLASDYGYEFFPSFSAFTREDQKEERFNQELRLVSTDDSALNWIVGAFYNNFEIDQTFWEFTPGYDQFLVDIGAGVQLRPDELEYYQTVDGEVTETAVFGEIGYQITDAWQITVGARGFKFEEDTTVGVAFPLLLTVFDGAPQDTIIYDPPGSLDGNDGDDDDIIFKINTSYDFTDDIMGYLTISEGYRLGGINPFAPCTDDAIAGQKACALPDEELYKSDTTVNYELGMHSQFGDNILLNGALFYIDWDDIQVGDLLENGGIPIIINGNSAESMGAEISGQWYITDTLSIMGSYAYTKAELTEDAPGLIDGSAQDGDRLPGSPEHQGFLAVNYALSLRDGSQLDFDWSMTASSDVITKVGERDFGESLDGYTLHRASTTWFKDSWNVTLYADNLFNEYAETGVRLDSSFIRPVEGFDLRNYYHNVVRPRQVGMRFVYNFDG
jgi:iron complex outermembrane receptor protein